jgi:hypothetical protein
MVVLKKIKASTLLETMVATVLLVVIFAVASNLMFSLLASESRGNIGSLKNRIYELEYAVIQNQISLPYQETWNTWEIQLWQGTSSERIIVDFSALNTANQKTVIYSIPLHDFKN